MTQSELKLDTELKRYRIKSDCWEEFIAVWHRIVAVRRRHGYKVLFALTDREKNMFTWAISHDGDFDEADKGYYSDPERIELKLVENYVADYEITRVFRQPIPPPTPGS